jgi:hypothetical protein
VQGLERRGAQSLTWCCGRHNRSPFCVPGRFLSVKHYTTKLG